MFYSTTSRTIHSAHKYRVFSYIETLYTLYVLRLVTGSVHIGPEIPFIYKVRKPSLFRAPFSVNITAKYTKINRKTDVQLSNIIGQVCESSGYLWSVIGHDSVADTLQ